MKKVLIVLVNIENGGVEGLISNILENMNKENLSLDCAYNRGAKNSIFAEKIKKHVNKFLRYGGWFYSPYAYLPKLAFYMWKYGPYDVVHVNSGIFNGAVLLIAKLLGIKERISHLHGDDLYGKSWKNTVKRPFKIFIKHFATIRFATSNLLGKNFYGNKDYQIIKNGILTSAFIYNEDIRQVLRKRYNVQDKFIIGNVSRFDKVKNHEFLIKVFKEIAVQKPNSYLLLIGDGKEENNIKKQVSDSGLKDKVLFLPPQTEINNFYQMIDCFILPSFQEGFGLVAIEAQCSGLPCFISDGVPNEANICNTTKISLKETPQKWAQIILGKMKNFKREDCSQRITQAGYDIKRVAKIIEKEYLG